jgi:hypothetical protein
MFVQANVAKNGCICVGWWGGNIWRGSRCWRPILFFGMICMIQGVAPWSNEIIEVTFRAVPGQV